MGMISAQIDELRNAAEFYDGFKAANLMRDAADTIWQLRDDLQRANAENAKLRELCVKALEWLRWAGGITCPPEVPDEFADELRELGVEVDA